MTIDVTNIVVTIPEGETESAFLDTGDKTVIKIGFPASMTGSAISFNEKYTNTDSADVYAIGNSAGPISVAFDANTSFALGADLQGVRYVQLVSDSIEGGDVDIAVTLSQKVFG